MKKNYLDYKPEIHKSCFIAETADVIGKVRISENSSVWYKSVLRGDVDYIEIGKNSNIQDNCVLHSDTGIKTIIGNNVTIGHGAIVHSCTIDDNVLIGMGAIILPNVKINKDVIIGAGSLVPPGKEIPSNSLVVGNPGRVVRMLTQKEIDDIGKLSVHYVELANEHK
ncbi:gamma carbonic anhydrase family protein [Clostridiaceae bacterium HSG29]|nr:gamma carbonic anhydrase family protein [Clostridiaceae bacterium HSG29]